MTFSFIVDKVDSWFQSEVGAMGEATIRIGRIVWCSSGSAAGWMKFCWGKAREDFQKMTPCWTKSTRIKDMSRCLGLADIHRNRMIHSCHKLDDQPLMFDFLYPPISGDIGGGSFSGLPQYIDEIRWTSMALAENRAGSGAEPALLRHVGALLGGLRKAQGGALRWKSMEHVDTCGTIMHNLWNIPDASWVDLWHTPFWSMLQLPGFAKCFAMSGWTRCDRLTVFASIGLAAACRKASERPRACR